MDKNTLTGLLLIGAILFGFTWYNNSKQKEYAREKAIADSIYRANAPVPAAVTPDSLALHAAPAPAPEVALPDHLGRELLASARSEERFYTVENDLSRITFSSRGGRVASVELKGYTTYGGDPLILFEESSSVFDLSFFINREFGTAQINTADYNFVPVDSTALAFREGETEKLFVMRLAIDSAACVEYRYTIRRDNYQVGFDVRFVGMEGRMTSNQGDMGVLWKMTTFQNEKGFENENNNTEIAYYYPGDTSIEQVRASKERKSENINTRLRWVAFKQQFFSTIFTARDDFQNGTVEYNTFSPGDHRLKEFQARLSVPVQAGGEYRFDFYFGPNKFSVLKKYDSHFERLVPLGGWIIGWVNRWLVIPTFDILGKHIASFGLIILILTILIKILIAPLTYKSYLSSAKMRLLKPEMDELNAKYPKQEDAMKKQQAVMALYKSAGVNPMGGCIPMLIQFPVLVAMFRFFPASIELRGERFLWADDLSSYDSVLDLPFSIPFYGDHVSLFTLLMAVALFVYSRISYAQTASSAPQMAGMKFMMLYMMPVMMLFFFNNFSSGLTYYYFLSNLITIGQTYAFRYAVNDEKLHRRMKENAKKPKKKSKWAQRLDEAVKAQQAQQAKGRRR